MTSTQPPFLLPIAGSGTCLARHYRDGSLLQVAWDDQGILTEIAPTRDSVEDVWIAPGLLDLQVNGYAGVDFQRPAETGQPELLRLVRALRRDGCRRLLLTIITCEWADLLQAISHYRPLIDSHPELRAAFVGWHIEGPFLSDQPGYSGAHNPAWMRDPSPELIRQLREMIGSAPALLTLAPEREGMAVSIAEAVHQGFTVSLGHTQARPPEMAQALAAGATAFTHLGNGCPQQLDRHANILWTALDHAELTIGVIPDGIHVAPELFRIFHQLRSPDRIYWTTDAMSAAGAPPGMYTIGSTAVIVAEDGVVRNPVTQTFAGSALSPIDGVRRGAAMLDRPWQEVWDFFSTHPARLMGLPGELAIGSPAGFCLLRSA